MWPQSCDEWETALFPPLYIKTLNYEIDSKKMSELEQSPPVMPHVTNPLQFNCGCQKGAPLSQNRPSQFPAKITGCNWAYFQSCIFYSIFYIREQGSSLLESTVCPL